MNQSESFSDAYVKHIDYFSEEWVKQLIMEVDTKKVSLVKPFVGCITYPGRLFPSAASNVPTLQFASTTYVGLMQMIFPDKISTLDDLPAYTILEINLDGVTRQFLTVSGGTLLAGALTFADFVKSLYPNANKPVPFNETAVHVLKDVQISGSKFEIVDGEFVNTGYLSGSHTLDYSFALSVAGYSIVIS